MPGRWDCRLSVPLPDLPSALGWLSFPSPHPTTPETLLTPSDNTQHQAYFHKYKASRVGQRGQTEVRGPGLRPAPLELSSTSSTQCLWIEPPLSTCSQNSACCPPPSSPGNELPDWGFCPGPWGI